MEIGLVIAGVLVGALLGILIGFLAGRQGSAGLRAKLAAQEEAFGGRLSAAVLEATRQVGEDLANRNSADAEARLAAQRATLANVVSPVQDKLGELAERVERAEEARIRAETNLENGLKEVTTLTADLSKNTGQLTSALSGTQTRGKWGEFQLQRIIEMAGLTERVTWQTQVVEGRLRPDLLVRIPEGRVLVVDAKAPALALDVDGPQEVTDKAYATLLQNHIRALGKRDYVEGITGAVGYVFLFLPSEAAYAGALRADPNILAFAAEHRVAVVAPSTLLSALTVVESIWRQFDANEHLEGAVNDARELHKRLQKFVEHLNKVGVSLSKAVDAYNASVSSFDSRLIPQARKIEAADLAPGQVVLELKAVTDSVNPIGTSAAVSTPSQLPSVSEPGTPTSLDSQLGSS